jgi:hypothetical protein
MTLFLMNFCYYLSLNTSSNWLYIFYIALGNFVVGRTLVLRNERISDSYFNMISAEKQKDTRSDSGKFEKSICSKDGKDLKTAALALQDSGSNGSNGNLDPNLILTRAPLLLPTLAPNPYLPHSVSLTLVSNPNS